MVFTLVFEDRDFGMKAVREFYIFEEIKESDEFRVNWRDLRTAQTAGNDHVCENHVNTMQNEPLERSRASSERQREREGEVQEAPRGAQSGQKDPKRRA